MKKTVLSLLTIAALTFSVSVAQDIKMKKDVVYIDKQEVAHFSGKASAFKGVDLNFMTLENKPLFNLKQVYMKQIHPSINTMVWTEIIDSNSDKKYCYYMDKPLFKEEKIVEDLLGKTDLAVLKGDFLTFDKINECEAIMADSIKVEEFKSGLSTALKEGHRNREDGELVFKLKAVEQIIYREQKSLKTYKLLNRYDFYQGEEFLGYITREELQHSGLHQMRYRVYKNLSREFVIGDETLKEVLAAEAELPTPNSMINTFQDFQENSMLTYGEPKDADHAEKDIVIFLVKKGYL